MEMDIHVVRPGDTMYQLAQQYGVSMDRLIQDNQLSDPSHLVVGQAIVVRYPKLTHTVKAGDTLWSIAQTHHTTVDQLLRNNPVLHGYDYIFPGQTLVIEFVSQPTDTLTVNGYAYPYLDSRSATAMFPYLSQLTPFSYRFTESGTLIPLRDDTLTDLAKKAGVAPIFHLSSLDEQENFSGALAHQLLTNEQAQQCLISAILKAVSQKGYLGVDVDFEYVYPEDSARYARFLTQLHRALAPQNIPLSVDLAPKTSDQQPGHFYEGHNYRLLSQAVDYALLMTYGWGYPGGPPMSIAPLPQVRKVLEYALTYFTSDRLYLGIPTYGLNWALPYQPNKQTPSLDHVQAVQLAWDRHAAIRYDQQAQAPWFRYVDEKGTEHEVWFEDVRSIQAKLNLAQEFGLYGVGYWNLNRPFPQNWTLLNGTTKIREETASDHL